ncbi:MAG: cytidine deaminase [Candidatus Wallbacteria bacterium HGW-Wallbacteria-1]|jgi:dCMP deaminase|uniref:Cytidine deaminase n=1 Tax=Candidatus Wallbacteria bacterium HGW-Wallbacteria-1 TaxID=2013854 RepID=A0A2N1PIB1_9BACT|nr:MAG: cytidine deaminase [Candidatus Wallbacteria bacterium HGW-Wallbacteria-1]
MGIDTPAPGAKRISKTAYYMTAAKAISLRSTCLRRRYGAVVVKNDSIVTSGYNGSPRGLANCVDSGSCYRQEMGIPHGSNYELCKSVHAEQNAIINAARTGGSSIIGGSMYIFGYDPLEPDRAFEVRPCRMCVRFIINAGIEKVYCCCNDVTDQGIQLLDLDALKNLCE